MKIHLFWEGPYLIDNMISFSKKYEDCGLYQIYGQHPLYGHSVLLYIGKVESQTFNVRISQENWASWHDDSNNIEIYIGRIAEKEHLSQEELKKRIDVSEKLLIYAHAPAYNQQNTKSLPVEIGLDHHVFNWGKKRDLFPEVSGMRFSSFNNYIEEMKIVKKIE